jgi:hypothetical protein
MGAVITDSGSTDQNVRPMNSHRGNQRASPFYAAIENALPRRGGPALAYRFAGQMDHGIATRELPRIGCGSKGHGPDRMTPGLKELRGSTANEAGGSRQGYVHGTVDPI